MAKPDPDHSTPASLAQAAEWHAANQALAELRERERKLGPDSVTTDEHTAARKRVDKATKALTIPAHLLRYSDQDWTHHSPLGKREQWRQAQDAWGIAHQIWRADFERLQAIKRQEA